MVNKVISIRKNKAILDSYRPLDDALINNLSEWFKIELTYSSNAIEGNTLSRIETAIVLQKGITIGGKLLKEHLEATNHSKAYDYIFNLINKKNIEELDILQIHNLILKGIDDNNAGKYRNISVRIIGSTTILPNPMKVQRLMIEFIERLNTIQDPIEKALYAHYELVTIHPFVDGNGRTARLLMNLILIQHGYPITIISPKERLKYLKALELAQTGRLKDDYRNLILEAIDKSLNIYIKAVKGGKLPLISLENLIKIGELVDKTNENLSTLRYWIKLGLLEVADTTKAGYQLFNKSEIEKCKKIRVLQNERFTLEEIQQALSESID